MGFSNAKTASTGGTAAQTLSLASFTPNANKIMVVTASCIRDGHLAAFSWGITGSGYTWTSWGASIDHGWDALNGQTDNFGQQVQVWTAPSGASPIAVTISVDAFNTTDGGYYAISYVEVDNVNQVLPISQINFAPTTDISVATEPITITHGASTLGQRLAQFFQHGPNAFTWDSDPTNWTSIAGSTISTAVGTTALESTTLGTSVTYGVTDASFGRLMGTMIEFAYEPVLVQSHYRFGADGTESGHGWEAAEDTGINKSAGYIGALRVQTDETAGAAKTFKRAIQYRQVGDPATEWRNVKP